MSARYYGDMTAAVQDAVAQLVEPGEEFDVADVCDIVASHTQASGKAAAMLTKVEVGRLVNALTRRSDHCLTSAGRGRYQFHGFGQDVVRGNLLQPATQRPDAYCPICHMAIPSSGVCGVCE
jgi:hypothetical protein